MTIYVNNVKMIYNSARISIDKRNKRLKEKQTNQNTNLDKNFLFVWIICILIIQTLF